MKSKNNGRREYPKNSFEYDVLSRWGRKYLCYIHNARGIKKFIKNNLNRRFRRYAKEEIKKDFK